MAIEGNVAQTACFRTTHLRNVPYTWAGLVLQQYGQGFLLAAGNIDTQGRESPARSEIEKEHVMLGMMEDAQLTHVLMSMCALDVLATIRDLCMDQAQSQWK